jgi:beta-N-acetylhexosaminidase
VISDKEKFKGFEFGVKLLSSLVKLNPESFKFNSYFDKLSGDKNLREALLQGKPVEEIISGWQKEIDDFKSVRQKYLLY